MRIRVALTATMSLCACDGSSHATAQKPVNVTSACEFATDAAGLDGRLVRFRSEWDVAVEHVRVLASGCPQLEVFLHHAADSSIDLTLCSEPNFRYGCPVNPDFAVKATFTGVFHASKSGGVVDVISMTEI